MNNEPGSVPDRSALMRMATGYLARYAASSHRLREVLTRRIGRRCRAAGLEPPEPEALAAALDDLTERLVALGLVDDRAVAAARARSLQRKGFAARRIRMALTHERLDTAAITDDDAPPIDDHTQARRYAARKRLGPFRAGEREPFRDKDLRSLQRAGFGYTVAVAVIDADEADLSG